MLELSLRRLCGRGGKLDGAVRVNVQDSPKPLSGCNSVRAGQPRSVTARRVSTTPRNHTGEAHAPISSSLSFIISDHDQQRASTCGLKRARSDEGEAVLACCAPYRASRGQLRPYDAVAMTSECEEIRPGAGASARERGAVIQHQTTAYKTSQSAEQA